MKPIIYCFHAPIAQQPKWMFDLAEFGKDKFTTIFPYVAFESYAEDALKALSDRKPKIESFGSLPFTTPVSLIDKNLHYCDYYTLKLAYPIPRADLLIVDLNINGDIGFFLALSKLVNTPIMGISDLVSIDPVIRGQIDFLTNSQPDNIQKLVLSLIS